VSATDAADRDSRLAHATTPITSSAADGATVSHRLRRAADRLVSSAPLLLGTLGTVLLFLFAVRLLGTATNAAAPALERLLRRIVVGDAAALGIGWLGAYALANGSVVAALALSLFDAGVVSASQLFLLIAGSRLGAAAVVVFVGALDHLQTERYSLRESVSMGMLTFLVTHTIYLPVTVLGSVLLRSRHGRLDTSHGWSVGVPAPRVFEPIATLIADGLGPGPALLLAVALLFGSLRLFDQVLGAVDTTTLRRRFFGHLERTWLSFGLGLLVTGATTSVAFSLGVIVPLYTRGYVERDELVPYVLGANLGTLFDTLVVAVVLDSAVGVAVVSELLAVATLVTLGVLVVHDPYARLVATVDDRLLADRRAFVAFVLSLVFVPLALLLVSVATT
jgi:sodium-dependent phosphate cotransporter